MTKAFFRSWIRLFNEQKTSIESNCLFLNALLVLCTIRVCQFIVVVQSMKKVFLHNILPFVFACWMDFLRFYFWNCVICEVLLKNQSFLKAKVSFFMTDRVYHIWCSLQSGYTPFLKTFLQLKQLFDSKKSVWRLPSFSVPKITVVRHVESD